MIKGDKVYLPSGLVFDEFNMCNCVPTVKYSGWIIDEYDNWVFIHTWHWAEVIRIKDSGRVCDLLLEDKGYQLIIYNVRSDVLRTVDDFIKLWEDE